MTRRLGKREAGDLTGSPADGRVPPKKYWWAFPAAAGGLTALWLVMNLPRKEEPDEPLPYVTKHAGWPDQFARWSVTRETGQTTYSSFSQAAFLSDLVVLAAPVVVAWVILRHLRRGPDRVVRHRGMRGAAPLPEHPPSSHPPGTAKATGGWG